MNTIILELDLTTYSLLKSLISDSGKILDLDSMIISKCDNIDSVSVDDLKELCSENNSDNEIELSDDESLKKYIINVGGSIFKLSGKELSVLKINPSDIPTDYINYIIDRDPKLFSQIIELLSKYESNNIPKIVRENPNKFSETFISELCDYELLDKSYYPKPIIKINIPDKKINFANDLITLIVDNKKFTTTYKTLSVSEKLKNITNETNISGIKSYDFNHILNLLRTSRLYYTNDTIIEKIEKIKIPNIYPKKSNNDISDKNIVMIYQPIDNSKMVSEQMTNMVASLDPRFNLNIPFKNKNLYDQSKNLNIGFNMENYNIITTKSQLNFGSQLIFNVSHNDSDFIEDLLLLIDIPVISEDKSYCYVPNIQYKIIESLSVQLINTNNQNEPITMISFPGEYLYYYPELYTNNCNYYRELSNGSSKISSIIYPSKSGDKIIEIHRLILPTFIFNNKNNCLPIKKLINSGINIEFVVNIADQNKILSDKTNDNIPLLNVILMANYINLSSHMLIPDLEKGVKTEKINDSHLLNKNFYIYNNVVKQKYVVYPSENNIYDSIIISMKSIKMIKDIFFVIVNKDDVPQIGQLIDMKILNDNKPYQLFDSLMLNNYFPLKKLGHSIGDSTYYYSFSPNPIEPNLSNGFIPFLYDIELRIKKNNYAILFFFNEYSKKII